MSKRLFALILGLFLVAPCFAGPVIKTVRAGATDVTVVIKIVDDTFGTPETGVLYNTSGIDLEYWRHGPNSVVDITETTQTVSGAHTDGGFVHIGHGNYRLDLPDAAVAAGVDAVEIQGTVSGMVVISGTVVLHTLASQTSVDTVDDYIDLEIAAIKAKTDQLTFTLENQLDVNAKSMNDLEICGTGVEGDAWTGECEE